MLSARLKSKDQLQTTHPGTESCLTTTRLPDLRLKVRDGHMIASKLTTSIFQLASFDRFIPGAQLRRVDPGSRVESTGAQSSSDCRNWLRSRDQASRVQRIDGLCGRIALFSRSLRGDWLRLGALSRGGWLRSLATVQNFVAQWVTPIRSKRQPGAERLLGLHHGIMRASTIAINSAIAPTTIFPFSNLRIVKEPYAILDVADVPFIR